MKIFLLFKDQLFAGLNDADYFIEKCETFPIAYDIVDVVANSLLLELQARWGRGAIWKESESSFIRRWNEGVFLPINILPSAAQLSSHSC